MATENVAEVVARVLAERGWTLGTIECATDGIVSRRLFDTDDGPAVLSDSVNVETVEDAIDLLSLPDQQFKAMGSFSSKAARAAAREGLGFLDVTWCLVVWAEPLPAAEGTQLGVPVTETVYLALNTGQEILEETHHYDGPADEMHNWLAERALSLVRGML
ncbi:MAG: CinA family protein [Anaerolineae bacterium]|jgi:nicotinamide mononucleotide (NMN) deamidase PncC